MGLENISMSYEATMRAGCEKRKADERGCLPGARPANSKTLMPFKGGAEAFAAIFAAEMDEFYKFFINGAS